MCLYVHLLVGVHLHLGLSLCLCEEPCPCIQAESVSSCVSSVSMHISLLWVSSPSLCVRICVTEWVTMGPPGSVSQSAATLYGLEHGNRNSCGVALVLAPRIHLQSREPGEPWNWPHCSSLGSGLGPAPGSLSAFPASAQTLSPPLPHCFPFHHPCPTCLLPLAILSRLSFPFLSSKPTFMSSWG